MLHGKPNYYGFEFRNWPANPAFVSAVTINVTPGASNVEGSWVQAASAANLSQDSYWMHFIVYDGNTNAAQKDHLLDIGVDPAGGTSYSPIISNIVCGCTGGGQNTGGKQFLFPFFIKAGSSVAVRIQGSNATAGTVKLAAVFYGQPSRPEYIPVGSFSETIGTITSSQGVGFTPGNAADGTWQLLGATVKAMWWWQLGWQVSNATQSAHHTYIELAHGDATNKHVIMKTLVHPATTEQQNDSTKSNLHFTEAYCPVAAGTNIYVRGRNSAAPVAGYNAVAIGIGG